MSNIKSLIDELRKHGLSNGSSLGYHSGLMDDAADTIEQLLAELKNAKTEARKEFAERLKREKATGMNWFGKEHYSVDIEEIDNLLEEMEKKEEV